MKLHFIAIILFLNFTFGYSQKTKDLNINYMLRGQMYASSSVIDSSALGGFGGSDNLAKSIKDIVFVEKGFFLKIDTTQTAVILNKFNGYKFFIVNKSDSIIKLTASDSRLSVIAQAFIDNEWKNIEYLPSSWCGNSYHSVFIKPNEYWEFNIPKFKGKIKTKIRYQLKLGKDFIYSNEIFASINKKQLIFKQGHKANGLMDPYND